MGKRVNYEIVGENGSVGVVLFANNSHDGVDPDRIFVDFLSSATSAISDMVVDLLSLRYRSDGGNNSMGQRIFNIDLAPGDHEYVLRAIPAAHTRGLPPESLRLERHNPDGTIDRLSPHTLQPVLRVPYLRALFQPQAWIEDHAVDSGTEIAFDAGPILLSLPADIFRRIVSEISSYGGDLDILAEEAGLVGRAPSRHSGPYSVRIHEPDLQVFLAGIGIDDVAAVFDDDLAAIRAKYTA